MSCEAFKVVVFGRRRRRRRVMDERLWLILEPSLIL
jgi:hypothetical protein